MRHGVDEHTAPSVSGFICIEPQGCALISSFLPPLLVIATVVVLATSSSSHLGHINARHNDCSLAVIPVVKRDLELLVGLLAQLLVELLPLLGLDIVLLLLLPLLLLLRLLLSFLQLPLAHLMVVLPLTLSLDELGLLVEEE